MLDVHEETGLTIEDLLEKGEAGFDDGQNAGESLHGELIRVVVKSFQFRDRSSAPDHYREDSLLYSYTNVKRIGALFRG